MAARVSKAEQSRRTRDALVAAAREQFARKGFAGAATGEIVAAARVTRGALYHQFRDKTELFEAVLEQVEAELIAELAARVAGQDDPVEVLRRSAADFLELCRRPDVRRIALIEAPSVLGWTKWRELDARYGLGLLRALLAAAAERGLVPAESVEPLSHLFLGALTEAAMSIAHADDDGETHARMRESLEWLIDRMLGAAAAE